MHKRFTNDSQTIITMITFLGEKTKTVARTRLSRRHGTDAQRKLGTDAGKLLARRATMVAVVVAAAAAAASAMPRSVAVVGGGGGGPGESAPARVARQLSAT